MTEPDRNVTRQVRDWWLARRSGEPQKLDLPAASVVVHAEVTSNQVILWVESNPSVQTASRWFQLFFSEDQLPRQAVHVKTMFKHGEKVTHLYEVYPEQERQPSPYGFEPTETPQTSSGASAVTMTTSHPTAAEPIPNYVPTQPINRSSWAQDSGACT